MGQPILDLQSVDLGKAVVDDAELRACLPHAEYFRLLDGVCHFDRERQIAVGWKDWDKNPWWAGGHVPGRPLMPGVLMIEGAAQIANFVAGGLQVSGRRLAKIHTQVFCNGAMTLETTVMGMML